MRILIVEDDAEISEGLKSVLEDEFFAVDVAGNFVQGWEKALVEDYDLMIFDWMLPDGDGQILCKLVRKEEVTTPILMLTAKSMAEDVVSALDSGADDYLVKPFDLKILLARIRALLRRKESLRTETIKIGNLDIDLSTRTVKRGEEIIDLSPKEFGILEYLLHNQERVVEREEILSHIWDENADSFSNTIDVHIRYLRKKLGETMIKTIRGKGYQICI